MGKGMLVMSGELINKVGKAIFDLIDLWYKEDYITILAARLGALLIMSANEKATELNKK